MKDLQIDSQFYISTPRKPLQHHRAMERKKAQIINDLFNALLLPISFFLLLLVLPIIEDSCWSELHKLNNDCLAATHARLGEQTSLHALAKKIK